MKAKTNGKPTTLNPFAEPTAEQAAVANVAVDPITNNVVASERFGFLGDQVDFTAHVHALRKQVDAVHAGNLTNAESTLVAQAHTLDAMFTMLARRAALNMDAGHFEATEMLLKLALRAQNQCRLRSCQPIAQAEHSPKVD